MQNIVILISGRGSNMQAIVDADLPGARIAAVISNRPRAAGLAWAAQQGLPTAIVDHTQFHDRDKFDQALMARIDSFQPDWVVLAGFMRILTPTFTRHYAGHLLNIHPSLLPAFPGLHTHQRALNMGCKVTGCTVHFVTENLDHGPIVAQGVVMIADEDTADTLAARVQQVEHQLYPDALRRLVNNEICLQHNKVPGMPVLIALAT